MNFKIITGLVQKAFFSDHCNKFIKILFLFGAFALPSNAMARPQGIEIEWQFPSSADVAEFRLYQDQYNLVCSTDKLNATSMACTVDFADCESVFSLTAYYSNGDESPHSPPYTFDACEKDKKLAVLSVALSLILKSDKE